MLPTISSTIRFDPNNDEEALNPELEMNVDVQNVTMKVLDGIFVGTKVYLV